MNPLGSRNDPGSRTVEPSFGGSVTAGVISRLGFLAAEGALDEVDPPGELRAQDERHGDDRGDHDLYDHAAGACIDVGEKIGHLPSTGCGSANGALMLAA